MNKVYSFALVGLIALGAFGFGGYAHAEEATTTEAVTPVVTQAHRSSSSVTLMPIYFLKEIGINTTPDAANAVWMLKLKDGTSVKDFVIKYWASHYKGA